MIRLSVKADFRELTRDLDKLARQQVPYATALALNAVGKAALAAERDAMRQQLDKPTPFTLRGPAMQPAIKAAPFVTLFIKDIQAAYLQPEIVGGRQVLGNKRAILKPVDQPVNQYGNLPRGLVKRLKGKSNIFVGPVKLKDGTTINGVWQRPAHGVGKLRLLIRFSDPVNVKTRYRWGDAIERVVRSPLVGAEFNAALARAIATAR